jgi:hypothetical protein
LHIVENCIGALSPWSLVEGPANVSQESVVSIFGVEAYCSVLKMEVAGSSEMLVGLPFFMPYGVTSHNKVIYTVTAMIAPSNTFMLQSNL